MYYSLIGILAISILLIENHDIVFKRTGDFAIPVWRKYKMFLTAVLVYYVTDVLWGLIESQKWGTLLFIDTLIYFCAMAAGILFWTQFVVAYLDENNTFGKVLIHTGRAFFALVIVLVTLNSYWPILFWVDEAAVYHATAVRHGILITQIVLFILVSLFTFCNIKKQREGMAIRYRTITLFGLIVGLFLFIQLWFPYWPLYGIAYLLGTCLLRTFVIMDEKEEFVRRLERSAQREKEQHEALQSARTLAYTDALTRVKSKLAYVEAESRKNLEIEEGRAADFAVAVFDINGLKDVNDKYGHEKGDEFIISACRLICRTFAHSPVFRVGGDEFVAILSGDDYRERKQLLEDFNSLMEQAKKEDSVVVAVGMSDYVKGKDHTISAVFDRADHQMYIRKRVLKE